MQGNIHLWKEKDLGGGEDWMSAGTIGNFLEEYTYEYLKESILEHVPDDRQKGRFHYI